ncbi:MAG: NADH-quinone oxidoreductase subunit C [Candidatus Zixiibacteriota bacterium]|nr:MAG: NADH-quinone oxidoreductase subunit C [candidate division Zixibacteria bacterium]
MSSVVEERLKKEYSDKIVELYSFRGDPNVVVKASDLIEICRFLKTDSELRFSFLSCITAADYLGIREKRFELVYVLYSIPKRLRVIIKVRVDDGGEAPSLTTLWDTANFQEREVYDMFGIKFTGHPDMTRILMDEDWIGHPQRKDFPLTYEVPHFTHNKDHIDSRHRSPWRGDE